MKLRFRAPLVISAFVLTAAMSQGAVVYSGIQNISVSNTFTSVYIDVDGLSGSSVKTAGWDAEVFFGGEAFGNSANFQPARQAIAVDSPIIRLSLGDLVTGSFNYFNADAGSSTHMGTAANQFASGSEGYLGFRLTDNNGGGPYYGWMRVNFSNTGGGGTIIDWAYENTGAPIGVGVIPEPQSVALGILGAALLAFRRRKIS